MCSFRKLWVCDVRIGIKNFSNVSKCVGMWKVRHGEFSGHLYARFLAAVCFIEIVWPNIFKSGGPNCEIALDCCSVCEYHRMFRYLRNSCVEENLYTFFFKPCSYFMLYVWRHIAKNTVSSMDESDGEFFV